MDDQYYFGNDTPDISSYLNTYKPLSLSLDEPSHSVRITVGLVLKALSLTVLVMWTVAANMLVFVVLYKNPRLQTVPNLLVANLAFSDLCLGLVVLPLSSVYTCAGEWLFPETLCQIFVSADILCSTASIWNLGVVGLDRYWAITAPVAYLNKRNKKTACLMISAVWLSSALISLAPLLGWKQVAEHGNLVKINGVWQCTFLDLPSYTIYSATGSFFIPTIVMFFVYYKIFRAFAKHRARQIYRQKVIRKHIESTILHEISHVLPTSDEFAKELEDEEEEEEERGANSESPAESSERNEDPQDKVACKINGTIMEESEEEEKEDKEALKEELRNTLARSEDDAIKYQQSPAISSMKPNQYNTKTPQAKQGSLFAVRAKSTKVQTTVLFQEDVPQQQQKEEVKHMPVTTIKSSPVPGVSSLKNTATAGSTDTKQGISWTSERGKLMKTKSSNEGESQARRSPRKLITQADRAATVSAITYEKVKRHKERKERVYRKSLQKKPRAISAAKERRGVKVLGIILGCFTICWTPFFVMYVVVQFCTGCSINPHIEMFITWLGYSNSAMNPIIYTVFNRDYQVALKRIFSSQIPKT